MTFSTTQRSFARNIMVLSEDEGMVTLGAELTEVIKDNYFQINPKKTRLHSRNKPKYVTGVKVNLSPNLPRAYIRRLRSMLHAWKKYGLEGAQEEFSRTYGGGNKS